MIDVRQPELRPFALEGCFGLEREALRVTRDGRMALTPHPFPADHPRIVRDFCENQTEINTGVHPTAEEAVAELEDVNRRLLARVGESGETLWTNSNPPPIRDEADVVPARFTGPLAGKSEYRDYLAGKYGKRLMAYCGIHVNFSFGDRLVAAAAGKTASPAALRDFRDGLYLHVASQCVKWGWAVVALTAASPAGQYASVRCSEAGYWNRFTPILDFSSAREYARSIVRYIRDGLLVAPSELYYPVRLKPRGPNRLPALVDEGIDHIEIRSVDLNPLTGGLVDVRDVEFIRLLLLWCAAQKRETLSAERQTESVEWLKAAARLDFDWTPVGELLERMEEFFAPSAGWPQSVRRALAFQAEKVYSPERRYSRMEACRV